MKADAPFAYWLWKLKVKQHLGPNARVEDVENGIRVWYEGKASPAFRSVTYRFPDPWCGWVTEHPEFSSDPRVAFQADVDGVQKGVRDAAEQILKSAGFVKDGDRWVDKGSIGPRNPKIGQTGAQIVRDLVREALKRREPVASREVPNKPKVSTKQVGRACFYVGDDVRLRPDCWAISMDGFQVSSVREHSRGKITAFDGQYVHVQTECDRLRAPFDRWERAGV